MVLKLKSLKVSLSHQYHLHSCRYTNFSKVKCWLTVCLIFSYRLASGAWAINECKAPYETTIGSSLKMDSFFFLFEKGYPPFCKTLRVIRFGLNLK